jgi:hypothetical protein
VPAPHWLQDEAAVVLENVPALQLEQADAPSTLENVPTPQTKHALAAPVEYVPTEHSWQVVAPAPEYVPGGQAEHGSCPVALKKPGEHCAAHAAGAENTSRLTPSDRSITPLYYTLSAPRSVCTSSSFVGINCAGSLRASEASTRGRV